MNLVLLLALLAAIALWVLFAYKSLTASKLAVTDAWSRLDAELASRHVVVGEWLDTMVHTSGGAPGGEIDAVARALKDARGAEAHPFELAVRSRTEKRLDVAIHSLIAKQVGASASGESVGGAQRLAASEEAIAAARRRYNDVAARYNERQRQIPAVFMAGIVATWTADLWDAEP